MASSPAAAGRVSRRVALPSLCAVLLVATVLRSRLFTSFVSGSPRGLSVRGGHLARDASKYDEPILRRDPFVQENMQRWIGQQVKLARREEGIRQDDDADKAAARKAAYLQRLGLGDKIQAAGSKPAWHLDHIKAGDRFEGYFSHPDLSRGDRLDLTFVATSDTEGTWSSEKAGFEQDVTIRQDFAITFDQGPERDMDLTSYIFHKFNMQWRDFDGPYPSADDLEYLSLKGTQLWFKYVAEVDGFPSEEDYRASCADPDKGMTKEEFLQFIKEDDPEYIDNTFLNVFTGRRINLFDSDLLLDGDFQKEAINHIYGYASYEGKPGGLFELILRR